MMTLFPHIPAAPLGCDGDLACGGSITATRAKVIKTVVTSGTASSDLITGQTGTDQIISIDHRHQQSHIQHGQYKINYKYMFSSTTMIMKNS